MLLSSVAALRILVRESLRNLNYKKKNLIKRELEYIKFSTKKKMKFYNFLLQIFKF